MRSWTERLLAGLLPLLPLWALSAAPAAFAEEEATIIEQVVVTGSRIARGNVESQVPLTTINAEDIAISGNTRLADVLFELPQTGLPEASLETGNFTVFAPGLATVDLRNLGETRTLVLLNGRRHVGADTENPSVVDLNSIPADLIDRVEVITGGASAVYGSEAMSGVVNVILKKDFEGFRLNTQYGESEQGDGEDKSISLTVGRGFDDGRGHATMFVGYQDTDEIRSADRKLSRSDNFLGDFEAYSSFAPQGSVITPAGTLTVDPATGLWNKRFVSSEDGYNRAEQRLLKLPLERLDWSAMVDYEFSEDLAFFLEGSYTKTESTNNLEPIFTGQFITVGRDLPLTMPGDNPFIPTEIAQVFADAGAPLTSDFENCDSAVETCEVTFRKRFVEVGPRTSDFDRETTRVALGFDGSLDVLNINWDGYYQWGRTKQSVSGSGDFNTLSFRLGLEAEADPDNPGGFRCRSELAQSLGCVPIDVFGVGSISPEAVAFVAVPASQSTIIEQQVVGLNLAGDFGEYFSLPGGPLAFAVGYEWRKEDYDRDTDPLAASGFSSSNASSPIEGNYDVWEVYAEVNLPLLEGVSFADYLGVDAAYRYSDYETVGGTDAWKVGLEWAPIEDIRFRSVLAQATRAPNIAELLEPGSETFESFIDPCINGGVGGPGSTAANCASLGIPADFDPGVNGSSAGGFQGGNPDLQEETSDTFTAGFVLTPRFAEMLSISVDYFDIEIKDAIESEDPQFKLNTCYASANFPNDPACDGIVRDLQGGGFDPIITRLDFGLNNFAKLTTKGVDVEIVYGFSGGFLGLQDHNFELSLLGTYTDEWKRVTKTGAVEDNLTEPGFPRVKYNSRLAWFYGPMTVAWSTRYHGHGTDDNDFSDEDWPRNTYNSVWYHDLYFKYSWERTDSTIDFFTGVKNLTDRDPPYIPEPSDNTNVGVGTAAGAFDVAGRFWYGGLTISL